MKISSVMNYVTLNYKLDCGTILAIRIAGNARVVTTIYR